MKIIRDKYFQIDEPTAVTIGKYDGIHKGHRKLISKACGYNEAGLKSALFTFDISPSDFFGNCSKLIYTNEEKEMLIEECGIDYLIEYPFTKETASLLPEQFFADILIGKLNAGAVIVGEDFFFGRNRSGDVNVLSELGKKYGIDIDVIAKERLHGEPISSTSIRKCIESGDISLAKDMLGSRYFIYGTVVHGRALGKTIGMPTINIIPKRNKLLPPYGVYASVVSCGGEKYSAVTNIGIKPTIDSGISPGIETNIINFDKDIYGREVIIMLYEYLRPEIKFESVEELLKQMKRDKDRAAIIISENNYCS